MLRLREFFSGEKTTMARNVGSQRPRASGEQRAAKKEAEKHIASPSSVAIAAENPESHASEAENPESHAAKQKPQARERLGRVR